jgi:hypothetical protein
MKYLKLYEGFDSNRVSAILSFLNKKIDKKDYDTEQFLKVLKKLADKFDFPLSTLSDKEIQYLPVNKALTVGKGEEAMNPSGTYCIKYWFSLEKGYLCSTGTGNKTMDYNKYNSYGTYRMSNEEGLDQSHLAYLSREYGIGGVITPARLGDLTTGDKVVMVCDDDFNGDPAYLTFGEIYADNRRNGDDVEYYFYQNVHDGSGPGTIRNNIVLPDRYNIYADTAAYRHSWSLGSAEEPSDDHLMLHKVILDEKPLRFREEDLEKMNKTEESVWDFNLPLDGTTLEEWTGRKTGTFNKVSKEANFAIILFLDDIIIKNIDDTKSDIMKRRKSLKKDTLALKKPEDIRKENVERYLTTLFTKLGIEKDKQEFKNLNSVVLSSIIGDYFIIALYNSSAYIDRLSDFITYLYRLMSESDNSYNFEKTYEMFKTIKKRRLKQTTTYSNGIKVIKDVDTENSKRMSDIIDRITNIGQILSNSIKSRNIETIEDLKSIQVRLASLYELVQDDIFILSRSVRGIITKIDSDTSSLKLNMIRTRYSEEEYNSDVKRLDKLEKVFKDLLR